MSATPDPRKHTTGQTLRDNLGQFIPAVKDPVIKLPTNQPSAKTTLDDPLVSININNPFKKLLLWFDQVRKKQNTELSLKVKLPLAVTLSIAAMALGIVTTGQYMYNWGKYIGITQAKATVVATPITRIGTLMGSKTAAGLHSRYILATPAGEVFILEPPPTANLLPFFDHRVLVTGHQDTITNILKVSSMNDIEIVD